MNQMLKQIHKEKTREQRIIDKGFNLALLNHVRQTVSNPNIFTVRSQTNLTKKWYMVLVDCDLDMITCDCEYFQKKAETCKHIIACCFYMGSKK